MLIEILYIMFFFSNQEPIHLRNRELLVLRAQLQQKVEELQKELEIKNSRGILQSSPPRMSSPVNV
jgi:myotubularin-related protein 1/2